MPAKESIFSTRRGKRQGIILPQEAWVKRVQQWRLATSIADRLRWGKVGRRTWCAVAVLFVISGGCSAQSSSPEPKSDEVEQSHPKTRVRLNLPPEAEHPKAAPPLESSSPSTTFEIPDATPIRMRLAQSVHGITRTLAKIKVYSHEGDKVRLVTADDVRVNGMVVIPKGARGQATVTNVQVPGLTSSGNFQKGMAIELFIPKTGSVSLELDWVEDITGNKVPLRALPSGESKPFVMTVYSENNGMVVRPPGFKREMKGLFSGHLRPWAPTGAHITAYVDGATDIDPEDLKQSQELLPIPNENGILTIYRTKEQISEHVQIFCDAKEIATLGVLQYVSIEVTPGKHSCRVGQEKPLDFEAHAGEQQFLHAHRKSAKIWELLPVGLDEGEDGTANGEIVEEIASPDPAQ